MPGWARASSWDQGAAIGPGVEVGDHTRIGANAVIAPGVAIGRGCEIGANVSISHAYVGDNVVILPGAQIGQPGFGLASFGGRPCDDSPTPAGSSSRTGWRSGPPPPSTAARSATQIGEGTRIDNLVQIAHNVHIGRHCVIAAQTGIAGSSVIEDFVAMGGHVGVGDHCHIGPGARLAARTGAVTGQTLAGGQDYGGTPAKPIRQWAREIHALNRLTARRQRAARTRMAEIG